MDSEGYPEESELKLIQEWDWQDIFGLIDFIEERWAYGHWGFKKEWGHDRMKLHKMPVLLLELHTGGWSGNESIINSLLENRMAVIVLGYYQWNTGGHYRFQCNPFSIGFKPVAEFAAQLSVSRQYIHRTKEKYDWLTVGKRNQLVRPKVREYSIDSTKTVKP